MSTPSLYYVGLDVHKKTISFCVQDRVGDILQEGRIPSTRSALDVWSRQLPQPWSGVLEATLFTGWIYDYLEPRAASLKVAHPARLQAIVAAKKKNDRLDARTLTDLLRCRLVPEVHLMAQPLRQLRTVLRYRNLLVNQTTRLKNKIAGLLMESGTPYNASRLHGKRYFQQLLTQLDHVPDSVLELLILSRQSLEYLSGLERRILRGLLQHPALARRVELLRSIPAVGTIAALTWALEIGDVQRFSSVAQAVSYCGLCSAQHESGGKSRRGPISKQRNQHLQHVLVEVAKLAPRHSPALRQVYETEKQRGDYNRATLAVARKLVAYLLAVDRRQTPFTVESTAP
ncbi:MAG: IS110 family transposase [Acidobacteriota bacterium]|nr:MAG: IS110 family transposase [Acidobacteriota bacterium]